MISNFYSMDSLESLFHRSGKRLFFAGILVAVLALLLSFLSPVQYRADAQVYILSTSRYGLDPYTVAKSAERIGENLAQVIKTSDFSGKVLMNQNFQLDRSYFDNAGSEREKRKRWEKSVEASVVFGTGVLNVSAYHKDPNQAIAYNSAIVETLVSQGSEYVGEDVEMKVVNQPVATNLPVRPNFLMNAVVGFAVGVFLMAFLVVRRNMKLRRSMDQRVG